MGAPYTLTPVHQVGPNFGSKRVRVSPNNIMHGVMFEAVNPPTLLLTSILDVLKVFEHHHMLWMGIWVHPYTLTPALGKATFWKYGG